MNNISSKPCLKLGIASYLPYMYVSGPDDAPVVRGSQPAILDIIFGYLGYCYEYVVVPGRDGGTKQPNGSWTGVIGMVLRGEIDMPGVGMALTYERNLDVAPSEFLYIDGWSAGFQRPVVQSDISGFVKPFSDYVWLLTAAALLGVLVTIWCVHLSHETIMGPRNPKGGALRNAENYVTRQSLLWTIAVFLAQSVTKLPRGNSVRVITGIWLLVSLILNTVYRSNLKAMLILPKVVLPFDNPEELAESGIATWIPRGSALHNAGLKSPPNSALGQIMERSNSLELPTDVPWGIRDMIAGKHAMTSPRGSLSAIMHETFSQTGQCLIYTMSENVLGMVQVSFLLRKDSHLKAELDPVIRRLREFGILDYEFKKQIFNATECQKPIGSQGARKLRPLDLGDFYGVFMLYAGGALMALVSFLMEVLLHKTKHSEKVDGDYNDENTRNSTMTKMKPGQGCPSGNTDGVLTTMVGLNNQSCIKIHAFMHSPYMTIRGTPDNLVVEGSMVEIHRIIFDKLGYW
ncbi:glutamate receptor ionotropic, delta-2-like [Penaeus japonicus]|uniref:glutamate receptor ionotropic, delta-2-like n=1 Tax=Penaeus japonicus TaxID=27405 RepID=UPI001C7103AB|nr:glutamate receptor ionotropic, delta-2-like [Penaeus japonicus]